MQITTRKSSAALGVTTTTQPLTPPRKKRQRPQIFSSSDEEDGGDSCCSNDDDKECDDEDLIEKDSFIATEDEVEEASSSSNDESSSLFSGCSDVEQHLELCSHKANTTPSSPTPKRRGRPPKPVTPKQQQKMPGHPTFPLNHFSLTIAKTKSDVELYVLESVYQFLIDNCVKGGVSTEVGHRAHNLHLQSVFSIKFPRDPKSVKELTKLIKALIKPPLTGYKVHLKPLSPNQTLTAMIGYITKDQGE